MKKTSLAPTINIDSLSRTVRGEKVMLDADLAQLFGVPTKALNQAVKRNSDRFPSDFMFQLTAEEHESLRSQIVTSSSERGGRRYLPYAFTEHGAIMVANVLNSPQAVQMSVYVVRVPQERDEDARRVARHARDDKEARGLEAELKSRLDVHEVAIVEILQRVMDILDPPPEPESPKRQIGFHVKDSKESGTKPKR
jgi:hypothetical protein